MIALPAYVAACNLLAIYRYEGYDKRAWCQVEQLMGYAFMTDGRAFMTPSLHDYPINS